MTHPAPAELRPFECRTCGPYVVKRFLEAAAAALVLVEAPRPPHGMPLTHEAAKVCRGLGHDVRVRAAYRNPYRSPGDL